MITTVVLGVVAFNLLWALYTTFTKEKIMIEQGEGPLASSTYSFIVLRYIARMGLYYTMFNLISVDWITTFSGIKLFFLVIAGAFIVEFLSAIIETLVRFLFFKVMYSKSNK